MGCEVPVGIGTRAVSSCVGPWRYGGSPESVSSRRRLRSAANASRRMRVASDDCVYTHDLGGGDDGGGGAGGDDGGCGGTAQGVSAETPSRSEEEEAPGGWGEI